MQEQEFSSLGLTLKVQVPNSVEEFDKLAGKEGAALAEAINNVAYRGLLADFRQSFIHGIDEVKADDAKGIAASPRYPGVEELVGIKRLTKTEKRGSGDKAKDVTVYDESEADYIKRVRVEKGWEEDDSELQKIADSIIKHLKFDPKAVARQPGQPKKLPEDYLNSAKKIFANGNQAKWATQFNLTLVPEEGDEKAVAEAREKNIQLVGWAIRADVLRKQKEEASKYQ